MNPDERSNILVSNYNSVKSILYRAKSVPSKPDPKIYTDIPDEDYLYSTRLMMIYL